jgi:hypothetical protein
MAKKQDVMPAPHSWGFSNWPWWVWPGDGVRGKRFVRTYEEQLFKVGALTRGGRELIVEGAGFTKFLHSQRHMVKDFECPANFTKRHNGNGATKGAEA